MVRKGTKAVQTNLELAIYDKLKELANGERRSMGAQAAVIIEDWLATRVVVHEPSGAGARKR